ncbi:MAG: ATPase, central region [Alphaproteobacteria bacterium]|nr:ATPase, central region [Alphaproteobacteria bacterium]
MNSKTRSLMPDGPPAVTADPDPLAALRGPAGSGGPSDGADAAVVEERPPASAAGVARYLADPLAAFAAAAVAAFATRRQRRALEGRRGLAAVFIIPAGSWVAPLAAGVSKAFGADYASAPKDGAGVAPDDPVQIAALLSGGKRVFGFAVASAQLPGALVASADMTVVIGAPTGAIVKAALRLCRSGPVPRNIPDDTVAGLDVNDIIGAMRAGSRAADVILRLRVASAAKAAAAAKPRLPSLRTAVEFGEARTWGLNLARDIADYRAKRINWADVDRGALLFSPPGYGKTFLAGMIAEAADLPLVAGSIGELFAVSSGNLDGVIKATRKLFDRARSEAPCLLLLDEIDALPNRQTMDERGRDWWTPVINDFLLQLDGAVAGREGVVVVGATNFIAGVDAALLRPGRLERTIRIAPLDAAGAENVLRYHLAGDLPADDLGELAAMMAGRSPADIMMTVRGARRLARHAGRPLSVADLAASVLPAEPVAPALLHRISLHEAGHAVVAVVQGVGTLRDVRIRGRSGGTAAVDFGEADVMVAGDIESQIVTILSGRAAERVILGAASFGSGGSDGSDLAVASSLAAAFLFSEGLGSQLAFLAKREAAAGLLAGNPDLRRRVERLLRKCQRQADATVRVHRDAIVAVAAQLAESRYLTGAAVRRIVEETKRGAAVPGSGSFH